VDEIVLTPSVQDHGPACDQLDLELKHSGDPFDKIHRGIGPSRLDLGDIAPRNSNGICELLLRLAESDPGIAREPGKRRSDRHGRIERTRAYPRLSVSQTVTALGICTDPIAVMLPFAECSTPMTPRIWTADDSWKDAQQAGTAYWLLMHRELARLRRGDPSRTPTVEEMRERASHLTDDAFP
jgi:hypothetical protein